MDVPLDAPEQPIHLRIRFAIVKDSIRSDRYIKCPTQIRVAEIIHIKASLVAEW